MWFPRHLPSMQRKSCLGDSWNDFWASTCYLQLAWMAGCNLIFFAPCTYPWAEVYQSSWIVWKRKNRRTPAHREPSQRIQTRDHPGTSQVVYKYIAAEKLLYYMADCQSNQNSQVLHKYCNNFYKYMFKFNFKFIKTLWIHIITIDPCPWHSLANQGSKEK